MFVPDLNGMQLPTDHRQHLIPCFACLIPSIRLSHPEWIRSCKLRKMIPSQRGRLPIFRDKQIPVTDGHRMDVFWSEGTQGRGGHVLILDVRQQSSSMSTNATAGPSVLSVVERVSARRAFLAGGSRSSLSDWSSSYSASSRALLAAPP